MDIAIYEVYVVSRFVMVAGSIMIGLALEKIANKFSLSVDSLCFTIFSKTNEDQGPLREN